MAAKRFQNLVEQYKFGCSQFADRPLFGVLETDVYQWSTYREFEANVEKAKNHLAELGLKKGDRLAIISRNSPEWATLVYGGMSLGIVYVPMYENQNPEEWNYIIRDAKPKILIAFDDVVLSKVNLSEFDFINEIVLIQAHKSRENIVAYKDILRASSPEAKPIDIAPRDLVALIYTSGTTGKPKGVMLCHENILVQCDSIEETLNISEDDRSLTILPWAHIYGQTCELHTHFRFGFSSGFVEDLTTIQKNIQDVKPTFLIGVPRIYHKVHDGIVNKIAAKPPFIQWLFKRAISIGFKALEEDVSVSERALYKIAETLIFRKIKRTLGGNLKFCISGAAPLRKATNEFFHSLGLPIYEGYGLTETAPLIAVNSPKYNRIGSVGRSFSHIELWLEHKEGCESDEGEIVVSGRGVMLGYYKLDDETNKVLTDDGKFHTGDIGKIEDGYLYITGRIKEQYKMENGKYVVPGPVEEEVSMCPFVDNSVLYGQGRPHNILVVQLNRVELTKWGEEQGEVLDAEEMIQDEKISQDISKIILGYINKVKKYEKPKACLFTLEEWTTENGFLTPSMKVKRKNVIEIFKDRIESYYNS